MQICIMTRRLDFFTLNLRHIMILFKMSINNKIKNMKKLFLFAVVGLMSLLGVSMLSSCDDKSTFMETGEFAPEFYLIKDETHISVIGTKDLVIEEAEKTDWEIYVPFKLVMSSKKPLEMVDTIIFIDNKGTKEEELHTNAQTFSIAIGGLTYSYTYMGEQRKLLCNSALAARAVIQEDEAKRSSDPFHEEGIIILTLESDDIVLARKEMPFTVDDF